MSPETGMKKMFVAAGVAMVVGAGVLRDAEA